MTGCRSLWYAEIRRQIPRINSHRCHYHDYYHPLLALLLVLVLILVLLSLLLLPLVCSCGFASCRTFLSSSLCSCYATFSTCRRAACQEVEAKTHPTVTTTLQLTQHIHDLPNSNSLIPRCRILQTYDALNTNKTYKQYTGL